MFEKTKIKIKNYFSFIFEPENEEKGAIIIPIAAWLFVVLATGFSLAGAWAWLTGSDAVLKAFASVIGQAVYGGAMLLLTAASAFLTYVLSPSFQNQNVTANTVYASAWRSVRDMGNMLIVLGFVAVGIATTLRIAEYAAKKILFPLIMVALLINFSGFFCGTIIQAADITTNALLSAGSASGNFASLTNIIETSEKATLADPSLKDDWEKKLATSIWLGVMSLLAAWIFLIFAKTKLNLFVVEFLSQNL